MVSPRLYFEIGPLKEKEYTGIAQVTAALAKEMIEDTTIDSSFFFGRMVVPKPVVRDLLKRRNGDLLEWYLQRATPQPAPHNPSIGNVAIFPNRKTCRRGFGKECQIIHDLSTLLTPQFHHRDTIEYHATTMEDDIMTNDITFCVSEATRSDVLAYFPAAAPESVYTILNAATISELPEISANSKPVERYILVLGTIEPRKNVSQILQYIRDRPEFSKRYRIVFLGRFGWGTSIDQLIAEYKLTAQYEAGRIVFPGFVTEHAKNLLIRSAKLLIYPSLFEGFGLPLLEAATLGVPSVTTRSSSLPEAGGPNAYYFDPFTPGDFERTLMRAVLDQEVRADEIRRGCLDWAANFSWNATYVRMKNRILDMFVPEAT
jgi:glycosyltransferase involved in cell wall biosynthesis